MMMRSALLYLAIASTCTAQQQQQHQQQRRVPMMGGYSPTDVKNPFVTSAAQFAFTSGSESEYSFALGGENSQIRVIKAEQQIVAGRNYKLTIEVANDDGCVGAFDVTIYDHFGELSVTHWGREYTCGSMEELKADTPGPESEVENGH